MTDQQIFAMSDALRKAVRPPQWEYDHAQYGAEGDFKQINERGREGWEACGVIPQPDGTAIVLLKRPVDTQREMQDKLRARRDQSKG